MSVFNRESFLASFVVSLEALQQSESTTKRELRALSRTVLEYIVETSDIGPVNRLLLVLTPVNRKVAFKYFEHFSGFVANEEATQFKGKSKKRWDNCVKEAKEFLADPHNNIWTWADRNIEITTKEFDIAQVTDAFKKFVKKAQKVNLTQKDVLKAVLSSGVELETILALMTEMYDVDADESKIVVIEKASA